MTPVAPAALPPALPASQTPVSSPNVNKRISSAIQNNFMELSHILMEAHLIPLIATRIDNSVSRASFALIVSQAVLGISAEERWDIFMQSLDEDSFFNALCMDDEKFLLFELHRRNQIQRIPPAVAQKSFLRFIRLGSLKLMKVLLPHPAIHLEFIKSTFFNFIRGDDGLFQGGIECLQHLLAQNLKHLEKDSFSLYTLAFSHRQIELARMLLRTDPNLFSNQLFYGELYVNRNMNCFFNPDFLPDKKLMATPEAELLMVEKPKFFSKEQVRNAIRYFEAKGDHASVDLILIHEKSGSCSCCLL